MKAIRVTASRSYDVLVQQGLLDQLGQQAAAAVGACKAALVSDDTVFALYGERAMQSLQRAGFEAVSFVFEHGEAQKNMHTYAALLQFLCDERLSRSDIIVALGGGVVGDLAGFAAATYLRGIRLVQVPTTLLAMVDSSVGGKTAIDMAGGKNQVGCFHQPSLVVCDPLLLQTLPHEQFLCGLAEVIKYAVLQDADLFALLQGDAAEENIEDIITACVRIKRDVVAQDEFDNGCRQLLNLGHTIGHAVEGCSDFAVLHGQAVAIGMAMMARACAKRGLCTAQTAERIVQLLQKHGLPIHTEYTAEQLHRVMLADKKRSGARIHLIVPREVGQCELLAVDTEALPQWLRDGGAV